MRPERSQLEIYRETFDRHRRLFLAPIAIAVVLAVWVTAGSPKAYEATTNIWVDNPPPANSSLGETDITILSPAAQEQMLLNEFLTTERFRLRVGQRGPLARYLATHDAAGWGPTALLGKLRPQASLNQRIAAALSPPHVLTTVVGPQILGIRLDAPAPEVAAGTLHALVDALNTAHTTLRLQRGQGTVAFYRAEVTAASKEVDRAKTKVAGYIARHPGATSRTDPNFRALVRAQHVAATRLAEATTRLNDAPSSLTAPPSASSFRVIDPPKMPLGATSGHKKTVFALVAGLFAGALVSLLALVALTPEARRDEEEAPRELYRREPEQPEEPVASAPPTRPPLARTPLTRRPASPNGKSARTGTRRTAR